MKTSNYGIYNKYLKRSFDFLLSFLAIIIFSPLFLVIIILIKLNLGSPVLFMQKRPGLNNEIFVMYKFRTMTFETDKEGNKLSDNLRLTKLGRLLRKTSLDELPELFNIFKGEMSFIGPRPQLVLDLVFMSSNVKNRHIVKPGLSGLAQVSGRNCISWEDKFMFDLEYINNITFSKDIYILFKTIFQVFFSKNINSMGMATAEDYGDYLLRTKKITENKYKILKVESLQLIENFNKLNSVEVK